VQCDAGMTYVIEQEVRPVLAPIRGWS
jgi:hypothetical protein